MVTKWGLSERLGPQTYSDDQGEVFLGRSVTQHKQVSDVTAHVIDEEIRRVIDTNYTRAKHLLETNLSKLHAMADALIRYETIGDDQIRDIMDGRDPRPPAGWEGGSKPGDMPPTAPAEATPDLGVSAPAGQH
jgi:cell division protease FtsH